MLSFLDCCEVEIVACTQIANTLIGTMKVIELGRTEARVADRAKDGCLLCGGSREILVVPKRVIGYTGDDIDEKLVPCPLCSIEE